MSKSPYEASQGLFTEGKERILMGELAHSIGILVYDGEDNMMEILLKKGTRLPASVTVEASLLMKFKNVAILKILEGESIYVPQENRTLGEFYMFRRLSIGKKEPIRITLRADEHKMLFVTCWWRNSQLLSKSLYYGFPQNDGYEMAKAFVMLKEASYTLKLLGERGIDVGSYELACGGLESDYHTCMTGGDSEAITSYLSRFHRFYLEIAFLERLHRLPICYEEKISQMKMDMKQYGTEEENAKFRFLETILTTQERKDQERAFERMVFLYDLLVRSHFELLQKRFFDYENERLSFIDDEKAKYWKDKAKRAIEENDSATLWNSICKLEKMRVRAINDIINSPYADFGRIEKGDDENAQ